MSSRTKFSYWALIPAAGAGARMGARLPKQYLRLHGQALLHWSLKPFLDSPWIDGVVVVLAPGDRRFARLAAAADPRVLTTSGGATRAESVLAGLELIRSCSAAARTYVLVHDAARPCVRRGDLLRLRREASDRHGGLLAVPAVDTLKQARRARAVTTLDRAHIWQAQTPQMFRLDLLQPALAACLRRGLAVTDEAGAMEQAGLRPRLVAAAAGNLKITYPEDLKLAEFWLGQPVSRGRTP